LWEEKIIDDNLLPLHLDYIGFHETKKDHFSNSFLKNVLGNRNFTWNHLPAIGTDGGIFVGVNCDLFEIVSWEIKQFSVIIVIKTKSMILCVKLLPDMVVLMRRKKDFILELHETRYGSTYEEKKHDQSGFRLLQKPLWL
jgi:hypothetical protein